MRTTNASVISRIKRENRLADSESSRLEVILHFRNERGLDSVVTFGVVFVVPSDQRRDEELPFAF